MKVLVLDLDDTLYPERDFALSGFRAASEVLRDRVEPARFLAAARRLFDAGHRGDVFDRALRDLGLEATPGCVAALVDAYRGHVPTISLYPDARWLLDWVTDPLRLALLTDGYASVQRRKVAALGIESHFLAIVYSDDAGRDHWKPAFTPYRAVERQIPADPADYVYVGDNPAKDFVTPKQRGWRTVRIRRPGGEHAAARCDEAHRAHTEIASLRELPAALRELGWELRDER